jgi:AAHS family benzoate transporter-like MFS transporter
VASGLADPYFSLYVLALGGSYFEVGLTGAIGSLFMVLPLVVAGSLTDVIGRKKLVVFLGLLLACVYVIFSQAPSWEFLLLAQSLTHLIEGFRSPAFASLVADSTEPEDRVLAIALQQRVPQAMRLISPILGGFIIDRVGLLPAMRGFYLLTFFACLATHLLRHKYLAETFTAGGGSLLAGLKSTLIDLKELPSRVPRQALFLIAINAVLHLALMTSDSYWVIYATGDVVGLTASQWGLVTIVQDIIMIVFTIVFSVAADRYGKSRFILASFLLAPLTITLFPFSRTFTEVLVLCAAFSLFTSLRTATFSALFIDYSPHAFRGRLNAFESVASRPTVIAGSLLGGYLYQNLSKATPFFLNAAIMGGVGAAFFLFIKESTAQE